MMTTEDVYANKKAFIEAQVRRLTTTLVPRREFKAALAATDNDHDKLSETMIDNAIYKRREQLAKANHDSEPCTAQTLQITI